MQKKLRAVLASLLCSLLMAGGIIGCLCSSFALTRADGGSPLPWVLLGAVLFGAMLPAAYLSKAKPYPVLCIFAVLLGAGVLLRKELLASLLTVIDAVLEQYEQAFDVPFRVSEGMSGNSLPILMLLTFFISDLCSRTVAEKQSCWSAILLTHPLLVLCLVLVFTPPAFLWLLAIILCDVLLVLTDRHRTVGSPDADALFLRLALSAACFLALVMLLHSPWKKDTADWIAEYDEKLSDFSEKLVSGELFPWNSEEPDEPGDGDEGRKKDTDHDKNDRPASFPIENPFQGDTLGGHAWDRSPERVNLQRIGRRTDSSAEVFRFRAEEDRTLYLRGISYGVYTGSSWEAAEDPDFEALAADGTLLTEQRGREHVLEIETYSPADVCYAPYYPLQLPEDALQVYDSYLRNLSGATTYTVAYNSEGGFSASSRYEEYVYRTYCQLPEHTRDALQPYVSEALDNPEAAEEQAEAAEAIRRYVQSSAVYSLDAERMPEGEDFALYFLSECDKGYCVHFATACTAMLRSAGIPARYVTGFMVDGREGIWVSATAHDAHAWVEYYDDVRGWVPIDPTPATEATVSPEPEAPREPGTPKPTTPDKGDRTEKTGTPETPDTEEPENITEAAEKTAFRLPGWVIAAAACLLLPVLWYLTVKLTRKKLLTKGSTNRRAIYLYRYTALLGAIGKTKVPETAELLGGKARFSNHRLTEAELLELTDTVKAQETDLLKKSAPVKRFLLRIALAI